MNTLEVDKIAHAPHIPLRASSMQHQKALTLSCNSWDCPRCLCLLPNQSCQLLAVYLFLL